MCICMMRAESSIITILALAFAAKVKSVQMGHSFNWSYSNSWAHQELELKPQQRLHHTNALLTVSDVETNLGCKWLANHYVKFRSGCLTMWIRLIDCQTNTKQAYRTNDTYHMYSKLYHKNVSALRTVQEMRPWQEVMKVRWVDLQDAEIFIFFTCNTCDTKQVCRRLWTWNPSCSTQPLIIQTGKQELSHSWVTRISSHMECWLINICSAMFKAGVGSHH